MIKKKKVCTTDKLLWKFFMKLIDNYFQINAASLARLRIHYLLHWG